MKKGLPIYPPKESKNKNLIYKNNKKNRVDKYEGCRGKTLTAYFNFFFIFT